MGDESFVLQGGNYKVAVFALLTVITAGILVPTLSGGPVWGHAFFAALLLAMVVFDVRWLRAKVSVKPSGLQLRSLFRTYNLGWDQVRDAEAVSSNGSNLVSLVEARTTDGRFIKVDGVGEWGNPSTATAVQQAVDLINNYSRGD